MRKYTAVPHPFVIEPPEGRKRAFKPGDSLMFGLTVIGRALDYLPYFIYAFDELGRTGLGRERGRFSLERVSQVDAKAQDDKAQAIYTSQEKTLHSVNPETLAGIMPGNSSAPISLKFMTPTRIIYNGGLTLDLEFHILIRQLLRRFSMLSYFHCDIDTSTWNFKNIIEQAKDVAVKERKLHWHDWQRYSNRQQTKMKMGGFVGKITFEGHLGQFLPLMQAGEIVHVGKGTSFGLGKYAIEG
jgi:CRISPR-associated endoribonuclease Cas6